MRASPQDPQPPNPGPRVLPENMGPFLGVPIIMKIMASWCLCCRLLFWKLPKLHDQMSCSLTLYVGSIIGVMKGDTRSLDHHQMPTMVPLGGLPPPSAP